MVGAGRDGPYCGRNGFKVMWEGYDLPLVRRRPGRLY